MELIKRGNPVENGTYHMAVHQWLKVLKLEFILKLKIKRNDWLIADPPCAEGRGQGVRTSLKNQILGFVRNTGLDPLKIKKLPSQHLILCHHP